MKKVKSILAVLIALCMLMPTVVLPVSAEIVEATGAVDAMEAISSAFDDTYLIESHKKADDGCMPSQKNTAYHGSCLIARRRDRKARANDRGGNGHILCRPHLSAI